MLDRNFWLGKRVFITGHTGFKGSWLCLWLHKLGADVHGYSLPPPTEPSLYNDAGIADLVQSTIADVRDASSLSRALAQCAPEIVIHMAAQSLVRASYEIPIETFSTNVLGTAQLLDSLRSVSTVRAVVAVTSDKCYHNEEWVWGYRENARLGGHDPYSASKACAELVVDAFRHSFYRAAEGQAFAAIASARAGNVIGGGDWARDRLIPDVLRSLLKSQTTLIRNPQATRPWQHVLEPLHGYLMLAERLYQGGGGQYQSAWNFGPDETSEKTVGWITDRLYELWQVDFLWTKDVNPGPSENTFLKLDAAKARAHLGWSPKLDLDTTLQWIVRWTKSYARGANSRDITLADIDAFMAIGPRS